MITWSKTQTSSAKTQSPIDGLILPNPVVDIQNASRILPPSRDRSTLASPSACITTRLITTTARANHPANNSHFPIWPVNKPDIRFALDFPSTNYLSRFFSTSSSPSLLSFWHLDSLLSLHHHGCSRRIRAANTWYETTTLSLPPFNQIRPHSPTFFDSYP